MFGRDVIGGTGMCVICIGGTTVFVPIVIVAISAVTIGFSSDSVSDSESLIEE